MSIGHYKVEGKEVFCVAKKWVVQNIPCTFESGRGGGYVGFGMLSVEVRRSPRPHDHTRGLHMEEEVVCGDVTRVFRPDSCWGLTLPIEKLN